MYESFLDQYYLFSIRLECGQILRLTDASHTIKDAKESYLPKSALKVKLASFNDNGSILIILEGSYEREGVVEDTQLLKCVATISTFDPKTSNVKPFAYCRCIKVEDFARNFRINLSSTVGKMNQNLAQKYSKVCRAQFGDKMCKIDTSKLSQEYEIKEAFGNTLYCISSPNEAKNRNHYFDNGTASVNMNVDRVSRVVLKHTLGKIVNYLGQNIQYETIIVRDPFPEYIMKEFTSKKISKITLVPGCNKFFETCCFYGNNINFQGEPFLP